MMSPPELDETIIPEPGQERNLVEPLLEMGWLLTAILVPLAVNLWARQPFEPAKAALLRSLAWVMAGLWLADGLPAGRSPWRELRHNRLLGPVLAVVIVQVLATALAVDPRLSLYGSYERAQGLLTQVSYPLLFLVVAARLRTLDQARRLVTAMVVTAVPLIGLGLVQAAGWDPIGLLTDARSPVYTTLGRSNFTGAYLAMLLPLTLALAWTAHPRWQRLAGLGLAAAELVVIALALARGAWLAAGVALATLGLLWTWRRLSHWWRIAAAGGGMVALAGVVGGVSWLGGQGGSTAARLDIWRATLGLIGRRPLLGYGPDSLGLVFPGVYPPQLVYYQGRGILVDRAHNLFLDWAVTGGVFGLLAGLALLVTFFILGWRAVQQASATGQRALLIASLAAVAGNVAGDLVSFDVTATATANWLLLALLPSLGKKPIPGEIPPSPQPSPPGERVQLPSMGGGAGGEGNRPQGETLPLTPALSPRGRGSWWPWLAAGLLLAGVGWAVIQLNARPLAADISVRAADDRAAAGDWEGAIAALERGVALWPVEPVHHQALSWAYLQQASVETGSPLPWLERAEAALSAARDLRPGDYRIWAALGELYGLWGNRWDAEKLAQADDAYRQAAALAPNHAMLYTAWGMVYQEGGQFATAATKFQQAVDLDATDGYAFAHLGDAELALGQVEEALAAYQQAVHWEPRLVPAYVGLARSYWLLGQRDAAEMILQQALQLDSSHPAVRALQQEMESRP
jgi:tetratricopeptide (TPR) repeat protein